MPTANKHKASRIWKAMIVGRPGTRKTGNLCSIIDNMDELGMERIVVQDWDDNFDPVPEFVHNKKNLEKVYYETLTDQMKGTPNGPVPVGIPEAYKNGMLLLNRWRVPIEGSYSLKGEPYDLGSPYKWGRETLLVIDTATGLGRAALLWIRALNNADANDRDWQYIAGAMQLQDKVLQLVKGLGCHVFVNCHIRFMGGGGKKRVQDSKGSDYFQTVDSDVDGTAYPYFLGKMLPPAAASYFNTVLETKLLGKHAFIRTVPETEINMPLKLPIKGLPDELPAENGLYTLFKKVLEHGEIDKPGTIEE